MKVQLSGTKRTFTASLVAVLCGVAGLASQVFAGEVAATDGKETKKVAETKPPEPRFKLYGWLEGGITGNPRSPLDNHNFGHLFTDRANEPLLNQASIVAERTLDPNATGFDWGFKAWFMYGSDARYIHSLGVVDLATNDRVQPDFPEVYLNLHLPVLTSGGADLKIGKYADPMSAETIDPRSNTFYSHSYIFNFGVPLNNTGAYLDQHVTKWLDIFAGINRGVNTSINDNNQSVAFEGGLGLNLLDGNLTVSALTHIGPEDPHNNHDYRYLNDITTVWKVTKSFTSTTDLNLIYDTLPGAGYGYGVAQYFTYAFNDVFSVGFRGEVFRDDNGFYVAEFRANNDFTHVLRGDTIPFDPSTRGGGKTTYSEFTLGFTVKPPMPKPIAGLMIRPEVRYDHTLTDSKPYLGSNGNFRDDQITLGLDVILQF
jgi:Putative beta-barrel porin-2, OmpL-like. bbp2